jgi:phage tail-like protein
MVMGNLGKLGRREDPVVSVRFGLEFQGKVSGMFRECSGLGSEHELVEHKAVQKGQPVLMKVPGTLKYDNIVLKRGVTTDMEIWDWRKEVEDGNLKRARRDGSITMHAQDGTEIARWNFFSGWPSKVSGPSLNAGTNEIGVEELTIVHEYMRRVKPGLGLP